jgi:uncharacterized protein (UPF0335 family)
MVYQKETKMQINEPQLESFISRIELLNQEKDNITTDIKEVYAEAKASGFDDKIMRKIVILRKKSKEDLTEEQILLNIYAKAVGLQLNLDV